MRCRLVCWLAVAATAGTASAQEPAAQAPSPGSVVAVRAGNHPGFGRLVFDVATGTQYTLTRTGDVVSLRFTPAAPVGAPAALARNILSATGGLGEAEVSVAPGVSLRPARIGERVVLDVLDAHAVAKSPADPLPLPPVPPEVIPPVAVAEAAPAGTPPESAVPEIHVPVPPDAAERARTPPPVEPVSPPQPATPASDVAGPVALVAAKTTPAVAGTGAAFSVPFGADVGAAALRRGGQALVVFDQRRPIDMAALRQDPVLGRASVQLLPSATLLRVPIPPGMELVLLRPSADSWTVALVGNAAPIRAIRPAQGAPEPAPSGLGRLLLPAEAPGQIVSLADPDSGDTLLLGTQRKSGQGFAVMRRTPRYGLLPTWQGVAVLPLADSLSLRINNDGFLLSGVDPPAPREGSADPESQADAAALTRRFEFPALSVPALLRRMQSQVAEAATAPPRARGGKRLAAAQTMIALGLGVEAEAMLQVAAEEDPAMAESADAAGLRAVAALLAGRTGESGAIDDSRLSGTDEIALWRAVRAARQNAGSAQAASVFAATLPLVQAYPDGLRDRLLALVTETMVVGGEAAAAAPVLARRKDDPRLALARAMKLQADGDTNGALAAYGAVAHDPDRRQSAVAADRAVEMALAEHRIDPAAAADALERQLFSWRGDRQELELRERVAGLRAQSGAWRPALALLRETLQVFPDQKPEVTALMRTVFGGLLSEKAAASVAPLDLIALLDENADLLAEQQNAATSDTGNLQAQLADKLLALDLPHRAGPQLERLMQAVPYGAGRAGFGATLAALKLREGDPQGALGTLSASEASDLPPGLAERRALLVAAAQARSGESAKALAALAPFSSDAAGEVRASILEQTADWPAATQALADLAAKLPAEGVLDENQRRLLVRLASAASQAGDEGMLDRLRTQQAPRMAGGPLADMFRLLTAGKIESAQDLKRAGREMALARTVPAGLKALGETTAQSQLAGSLPGGAQPR